MARWGLFFGLIIIIMALFLGSGIFTYFPGSTQWETKDAGFFTGLIHGVIAPIMLAIAVFTEYSMYESHNIGWFYEFGFIIGLLLVWGGGQTTKNIVKNYYVNKVPGDNRVEPIGGMGKSMIEKIKNIGKSSASNEKASEKPAEVEVKMPKTTKTPKTDIIEKKLPAGSVKSGDKKAKK